MEHHAGYPGGGHADDKETGDLKDRSEQGLAACPEAAVHDIVAGTDGSCCQVDEEHVLAVAERLCAQAEKPQQGLIKQETDGHNAEGDGRAEGCKALYILISLHVVAGSHLLAHNNGAGVCETAEKCKHKALQHAEGGHGSDGRLGLMPDDDVDEHLSNTVEQLIAENRKALFQIGAGETALPVKHHAKLEGDGSFIPAEKEKQDNQVHNAGNQRTYCGAGSAHLGHSETAVDENPVQDKVGDKGGDRAEKGSLHPLCGAHKKTDNHSQNLKWIGEAYNPYVGDGYFYNIFLICINSKEKSRVRHSYTAEYQTYHQHTHHGKAEGTIDAFFISRSPILGEKQHGTSCKAKITGEKQGGNLRTDSHRRHGQFTLASDHNGIYHAGRGR